MRRVISVWCIQIQVALWGLCCVSVAFALFSQRSEASADETGDIMVSMVRLLTSPSEADGLTVHVIGYLEDDIDLRLYLTRDHASLPDIMSSIAVQTRAKGDSASRCAGSYALVIGKFGRSNFGSFEILETLRIERWDPKSGKLEHCWTREKAQR